MNEMNPERYCVIMAGGSGQRFWPSSRKVLPKQLLSIEEGITLVQATLARVPDSVGPENTLIITNAAQVEALKKQVDLPADNIIAEPVGRDTAPCIGLAAKIIASRCANAVMAVMAADHVISPMQAFQSDLEVAMSFAGKEDAIVTIGIKPTSPATGYGYIHLGDLMESSVHQVQAFKEKPQKEVAEAFLADGGYLWNSGIFIWRCDRILREIENHLPELSQGLDLLAPVIGTDAFQEHLEDLFPRFPKMSIDKGVIEHAANRYCVKASFDWDDVGSLAALARHNDKDEAKNTNLGDVVVLDTKNCIADNRTEGILTLLGVEDLVVVRTKDAVLVARRGKEEDVKKLVEKLDAEGKGEFL